MQARNSDGALTNQEPPKNISVREALSIHMGRKPGGMTSQELEELDRDFPVPIEPKPSQFGHIGGGGRQPPRTGDPAVPLDHSDWLARKEEILKEAFPEDPRYRNQ